MRNRWLLLFGGVFVVVGAIMYVLAATLPGLYLAGMGVVLIAAGFLVGPRYSRELTAPPAGYAFTGERFVDPTTKHTVEVWQHPQSGQRAYVLAEDPTRPTRGS